MNNIEVYNEDCFDRLKKIENNSIDLFILDLPYATLKFGKAVSCDWDMPINLDEMWVEIKRTMKPEAVIIFFCNTKFGYCLIHSNPKWFKYDLIYKKGNKSVGFLSANKRQLRNHENIYIFKNKQGTYNPQKTQGKPYKQNRGGSGYYPQNHKIDYAETDNRSGLRHPTSILDYTPPRRTIHKTQKPVLLLEYLIKTYSNENDIVCDFCMGSGSTAIASINTKRKFIGVEKDKKIYDLAYKRIEEHYKKNIKDI